MHRIPHLAALAGMFVAPLFAALLTRPVAPAPEAAPVLTTEFVSVTPLSIHPLDVLTIHLQIRSHTSAKTVATPIVRVDSPDGRIIRTFQQQDIAVAGNRDMDIYWVWRLPHELSPGLYQVRGSVAWPNAESRSVSTQLVVLD